MAHHRQCSLISSAFAFSLLFGCTDPSVPGTVRVLDPSELARARSAAPYGDAAASFGGRDYIGFAGIEIDSVTERITLHVGGRATGHPGAGWGGQIPVPIQLIGNLADEGADFTLALNTDLVFTEEQYGSIAGELIGDGFQTMELSLRAEPDGLFVGSLLMGHADGRRLTIEIYGRLTAGCGGLDDRGGNITIADPRTVPLCDDIMREL